MSKRTSGAGDTPGQAESDRGDWETRTGRRWAEYAALPVILAVTLGSLFFFYTRGLTNLYGDAIAHTEGARRIFDSLTPGYQEIGTVWLPLFHLLASPLAVNDYLWQTGLAGGLVSATAFAVAAWTLFRLALEMNRNLAAGWLALAGFLFCPNMAYAASTAFTEPLEILWAVLVAYGLFRYRESGRKAALLGSALAALLGTLTRYDMWYLLPFASVYVFYAWPDPWKARVRHAALFSAIAVSGPLLWLLHNALRFGNALEFYNGPYSAQAIYAHQVATTGFRYPTDGSLLLSARYYLASMTLVIGALPLELAILGLIAWALDARARPRRAAALLLLVPFPFYVHSMARAAVPLYVPTLFPHTYYNLRYGLEMLPAVALLPSFLLGLQASRRMRAVLVALLLAAVVGQAIAVVKGGARELPVVKEAVLNTPCGSKRQQAVVRFLRGRYDGGTVLVAAGKWPCLMPELGIPFRKTLSETNRKLWIQLPRGPEPWVEWIILGDGDPVDELVRAYPQAFRNYDLLARESFPGEGSVDIYRRR